MATEKQKKLAKAIVENATADQPRTMKELVVSSGYDTTTAEKQVPAVVNQKGVQDEIHTIIQAMEDEGITSKRIASKINTLLNAKSPIYKNNNETGEIEHVGDKPDYQAIDKGISHALKIGVGGGYKTDEQPKPSAITYNLFNLPGVKGTVAQFEDQLKRQLMQDVQTIEKPMEA